MSSAPGSIRATVKIGSPTGVSTTVKQIAWLLTCWIAFAHVSPSAGRADATPAAALNQRLEALDDRERTLLSPMLERGPVALVELVKDDTLPSVLVATYVDAPAELVARIVANPKDYPKFMKTLDHVEVLSQNKTQTAYKWSWQTGVLFLEGENRMTAFPPPAGHPELGHRISVKSERGQLGEGRLLWRVFPAGEKRSLLMLVMRVDMREANFVMKQLQAAAKSVNRSVNLALCYVMVLGTKREAERRSGQPSTTLAQSVALEAPTYDVVKLRPLLGRADLLLMELTPSGIGKLSIYGRTGLSPEAIRPVMTEPETFGKALVPGSYTRVTKREGAQKTFEWGINLPLIGTSGTMLMKDVGPTLSIDATEGALKGGKWRFETPTLPGGEAVVLGYSAFDITKATWLIEKIAAMDPAMGHGLAAASQVMMLRALRKRAHEEAKLNKARSTPKSSAAPKAPSPSAPPAPPTPASPSAPSAPAPEAATSSSAPSSPQAPATTPP